MSSLEISVVALLCLVLGFMLGMWLQYLLPEHHLSKESQDTVKLGAGMVATMSALILGLLVSSAKTITISRIHSYMKLFGLSERYPSKPTFICEIRRYINLVEQFRSVESPKLWVSIA
jgi:L-cystine uptake protein TcyP (sodium:dicarboxylate symporter family)